MELCHARNKYSQNTITDHIQITLLQSASGTLDLLLFSFQIWSNYKAKKDPKVISNI